MRFILSSVVSSSGYIKPKSRDATDISLISDKVQSSLRASDDTKIVHNKSEAWLKTYDLEAKRHTCR